MSKQKYREDVHKILDLVMDIQEKQSISTRVGFEIYPGTKDLAVFVYEGKGGLSAMYCTNYQKTDGMDSAAEMIEALEKIKARGRL